MTVSPVDSSKSEVHSTAGQVSFLTLAKELHAPESCLDCIPYLDVFSLIVLVLLQVWKYEVFGKAKWQKCYWATDHVATLKYHVVLCNISLCLGPLLYWPIKAISSDLWILREGLKWLKNNTYICVPCKLNDSILFAQILKTTDPLSLGLYYTTDKIPFPLDNI